MLSRLLDQLAIRWLHRRQVWEGQLVLCGLEYPGGWWYTHLPAGAVPRPQAVLGQPPLPVTEWSERRLRRWLRNHPEPA
jgi:hypothetical protein